VRVRSLAGRLAIMQQGLTLAVIVIFAGSSLWLTAQVLQKQERALIEDTATRVARGYDAELEEESSPVLAAQVTIEEQATPGVHVEIYDHAGRLLATSKRNASARPGARQREPAASDRIQSVANSTSGARIHASMSDELQRASTTALAVSLVISALPLSIELVAA
jgi:uncharacterized membrane protein affecting hemolysin expression